MFKKESKREMSINENGDLVISEIMMTIIPKEKIYEHFSMSELSMPKDIDTTVFKINDKCDHKLENEFTLKTEKYGYVTCTQCGTNFKLLDLESNSLKRLIIKGMVNSHDLVHNIILFCIRPDQTKIKFDYLRTLCNIKELSDVDRRYFLDMCNVICNNFYYYSDYKHISKFIDRFLNINLKSADIV